MAEQWMVVLYGASVFVAGVETWLRDRPGLEVVRIIPTFPDAGQRLKSLCPNVIIFDSGDARLDFLPGMTQLLKDNPDVLVIGLDLISSTITILSGRQCPAAKVEDLVEAIQSGIG